MTACNALARRTLLAWALLLCLGELRAADKVELVVDASRPGGTVKALHGVNGGPLNTGGTLDLSAPFKELAPPLARLHDCHWPNPDVVDVHVLFPDWRADPAKPESYDFARTDEYVAALLKTGAHIVFRLGESIEHQKIKKHVHPPDDPVKWAAVCVGIVRHYNDGWAGGFRHNIRYWEVWNEPDNRPAMWTGTDDDYLRLYSATAKALKKRFPELKVGGPGLGNTGRLDGDKLEPPPFLKKFLDHCRKDEAPLDFFSWHTYSGDPRTLPRRARAVRRLLDDAGFPKAESHLNEWNYLPGDDWGPMLSADARARQRWYERLGGPEGAAFAAAALLLLQDAPVDAANYFSAEPQGMGLFSCHGVPLKTFHALKAFKALADTAKRLPVRGAVPAGLAAGAGVNEGRTEVVVLLSKFDGPDVKLSLSLWKLPWEGKTRYEILAVDGERDLTAVEEDALDAEGGLTREWKGPGVWLVRCRQAK